MRRFTDVCERNIKYAISYAKALLLLSICFTLKYLLFPNSISELFAKRAFILLWFFIELKSFRAKCTLSCT